MIPITFIFSRVALKLFGLRTFTVFKITGPQRPFVYVNYIYYIYHIRNQNQSTCKIFKTILKTLNPLHVNINNIFYQKITIF